jgi:hypothetical protein
MTNEDHGRAVGSVLDPGSGASRPETPVVHRPGLAGRWPTRRLVAAGAVAGLLAAAVQLFVGWNLTGAPTWAALTAITLVLGSLALATFLPLPGHGRGLDVGCTPCAAGGGLLALAGMWLAISSAYDGGNASLGVALAGAALVRRVTEPTTCET